MHVCLVVRHESLMQHNYQVTFFARILRDGCYVCVLPLAFCSVKDEMMLTSFPK